ncbi:hypothetical protein VaNZ11_003459 [Volvox africanus]|uniref:Methyltransferase domain-containing protein n=1 Tax=Volvox africanus TaxID=51714 RepID=A0ABQ5RU78_9CHLO|nr:hypothetical protein VaNZ11_003459 [Volvox africanus]
MLVACGLRRMKYPNQFLTRNTRCRLVATRAVQVETEVKDASNAPSELKSYQADGATPPQTPPVSYPVAAPAVSAVDAVEISPKVADLDAQRFQLHPSVQYWQSFTSYINTTFVDTDLRSLPATLQQLVQRTSDSAVLRDPRAAAYWAYHTARMSFFIGQAVTGLFAHHLSETLPSSITGLSSSWAEGGNISSGGTQRKEGFSSADAKTPFQRISSNAGRELLNRVNEVLGTFGQDYDNIRAGIYPMPWDMTPSHRQNNPLFMLARTTQSMRESVATLRRRVRGQAQPMWLSSSLYPQYYTKTYHYQTDGWLSDRSARIYEHNTELLFLGRQDAMQRTSLLPIAEYMREATLGGRSPRDVKLLEVAAGTGRFHTFIKDAYPEMPSVVSDMSPFYLDRARNNLSYWRALRQPGRRLGGVDDTGVTRFLQTAAEQIDAPDQEYDLVVCLYLFHELPEAVRRQAAAEFFRVLQPGGMAVLTDSVQLGDRPAWDESIGAFGDFNEPYYRSYVSCDLGAMFEEVGFMCDTKYLCSATKTLSFRKPLD